MDGDVALDGVAGPGVHDAPAPHALHLGVRVLVARGGAARDGADLRGQLGGDLGNGTETKGKQSSGVIVGWMEAHVLDVWRIEVITVTSSRSRIGTS